MWGGDAKNYYLRDNSGVNISKKNNYYCELTGLYWNWKNYNEGIDEITGLVHYRRYFISRWDDLKYRYFNIRPQYALKRVIIEKKLGKYDCIVTKPKRRFKSNYEFYALCHIGEDLDILRKTVEEVSPEYVDSYNSVMDSFYQYYGNMIICKRKLLNEYCEWLFRILDVFETKIDIDKYSDNYQKRVFGFVAERLLQVYVEKHELKVKTFPVYNTEGEKGFTLLQMVVFSLKVLKDKIKDK